MKDKMDKKRTNYKNILKLGLCIIAFEGTELLFNIISELRDSVDYVSIGLLKLSYHGDKMAAVDIAEIYRLKDEDHLVDNIVDIVLDISKEPRVLETDKRNMLIQDAEDHGCSHCIVIDSDEYYTKKSFEYACQLIDLHNYEMTYCQYINYYHDYTHFLVYPFKLGMYVPFVTKTKYRHKFDCTDFNMPSDPTRRYVRPVKTVKKVVDGNGQVREIKEFAVDYHIFPWNVVKMHHLSWLRADIRKKLNMWSSKTCFANYNDLIDRAVHSFNNFDENSTSAQALMLFNTPNNSVEVKAFPKQYIHPKVDFMTRLRKVPNYKKLLFLSMSADYPVFNTLEQVCNETWRNVDKRFKNIDAEFWTYTDAKPGEETHVDMKNHIIYIKLNYNRDKVEIGYYHTLSKTFAALREIQKLGIKYDYLIRTNNSTWINVPLINLFLAYQEDDSNIFCGRIYSFFWSAFNLYGGGELLIFSKRNIGIILDIEKDPEAFERRNPGCDDNLMFGLWNARLVHLKLPQTEFIHSIEDAQLINDKLPDDIDFTYPAYQIKTYFIDGEPIYGKEETYFFENRLSKDINKMKTLDKMFRDLKDYDPLKGYEYLMENYYDKLVYAYPGNRNEWNNLPSVDKAVAKFKYKMDRSEAKEFVSKMQKDNGYTQAII